MNTKHWLFYTLIIGALPLIVRWFILLFLEDATWGMAVNPIDFVFLGLTLNLTNIIELNNVKKSNKYAAEFWERNILWSIITIIIQAVILGVLYLDEFVHISVLRVVSLKVASVALCLFSLVFSYVLVRKMNAKKL